MSASDCAGAGDTMPTSSTQIHKAVKNIFCSSLVLSMQFSLAFLKFTVLPARHAEWDMGRHGDGFPRLRVSGQGVSRSMVIPA